MKKARKALEELPRCAAYSRQTGQPCRNAVMSNGKGRCRMHGGKSSGRPPKHGKYTKENKLQRDWGRLLLAVVALREGHKVRQLKPGLMTLERAEEVLALKLNGIHKKNDIKIS